MAWNQELHARVSRRILLRPQSLPAWRCAVFLVLTSLLTACASDSGSNLKLPGLFSFSPLETVETKWSTAALVCSRKLVDDSGGKFCESMSFRGRRLECLVDNFSNEETAKVHSSPEALGAWRFCMGETAQLLIKGYYLPPSEVDRRIQYCNAVYEATPAKPQPHPLADASHFDFAEFMNGNSEVKKTLEKQRPSPAEYGVNTKAPITGLMRCDWMMQQTVASSFELSPPKEEVAPPPPAPVVVETPPTPPLPEGDPKAKKKTDKPAAGAAKTAPKELPPQPAPLPSTAPGMKSI